MKNREKPNWEEYYELAKIFYKKHGNLEIPYYFKTINGFYYDEMGIKLGAWIYDQRTLYKNNGLSIEQIKLLEKIDMIWFCKIKDHAFQSRTINENNIEKKKKELLKRFNILLNSYVDIIPSREQINDDFIDQLNHKKL